MNIIVIKFSFTLSLCIDIKWAKFKNVDISIELSRSPNCTNKIRWYELMHSSSRC